MKIKLIITALLIIYNIANTVELSVKQTYDLAVIHNDAIKSSIEGEKKAKKLALASKMSYIPQIDVIANYTYIDNPINLHFNTNGIPILPPMNISKNLSSRNIVYGIINITYPIFTGGKRIFINKIAKLDIDDADYILNLKKLNLFEELVKVYYGLILNIEILNTLKDIEIGHKTHLDNAIKMEDNGMVAKIERLNAQVEYDKAKHKTHQAREVLQTALIAFKNIVQEKELDQIQINDDTLENLELTSELKISKKNLDDIETIKQLVISQYPSLKSLEIKEMQAKELSKVELSNFMPNIGLYGGYIFKDNDIPINKTVPNWYVGVGAKLSLLSSSGRIFRYQASKIAENEIRYTLEQVKKDILLLTEKTYREISSARDSYNNLESTLQLAEENLKLQEEAFANGLGNSAGVSDARNALSAALIEIKNTEYKYIISLARLCALVNNIDMFYTFY